MTKTFASRFACLCLSVSPLALAVVAAPAAAQVQTRPFDIPAQPLSSAILEFSRQADVMVVLPPELAAGKKSAAVKGSLPVNVAIGRLLKSSGLRAVPNPAGGYRVGPLARDRVAEAPPSATEARASTIADNEGSDIVVTGSRIRGAPSAAPVTTVTAEDAKNAGQADLGQVIRSLPQNFTGGQNPGIVGGAAQSAGSLDLNGASSVNFRGLGPAASLTLLNGRRLAYGGVNQGVDISAVPLAAVERLEVVADGGSALYGSDAIGGVANIILKRDFKGLQTEMLYGGSTDGGYTRRQFSATAGQTWGSGGVIISGVAERTGEVTAGDRSYARPLNASTVLFPGTKTWGGLVSGHQDLVDWASFGIDALYNHRSRRTAEASTVGSPASVSGSNSAVSDASYLFSPHVDFVLPGRWHASVNGTYGQDKTHLDAVIASAGVTAESIINYRNRTHVVEVNGEGPLATLPGGDLRLAVGAGYREVSLVRLVQAVPTSPVVNDWSQSNAYGFGELFVPIVSPLQSISGIDRLSLSAAIRYEDYRGTDKVTTPKFGVIYAPVSDFQIGGTWGKSFKTPTLFELYQGVGATLARPTSFGGTQVTPTSTVLFLSGGNPNLKAERSTNWTVTGTFHPSAIKGLKIEAGYYNIAYRDRIISPITTTSAALSNPVFAQFIVRSPSEAELTADIASANSPLRNISTFPYIPSAVVAIVDGRLKNVARQTASGVDLSMSYRADVGEGQNLVAAAGATYLELKNKLRPADLTAVPLAGTIFNPPHWHGRGSITWENKRGTVGIFANYLGPLDDVRVGSKIPRLSSQMTFDLTTAVRFRLPEVAQEVELRFAALNLLDAKPKAIYTTSQTATPFEAVNYSVLGRQLTVSLGVKW